MTITPQSKSQYKTWQKAEITAYLLSMAGEHVTVNDICQHFEKKGKPIGVTTVYRQLDKLVAEGVVNKYTLDSSSSACYEYVDTDHHSDGVTNCYHCKCDRCGKLIHLHCEEIEELIKHIEADHSFVINPRRMVFYGVCDDCKGLVGAEGGMTNA